MKMSRTEGLWANCELGGPDATARSANHSPQFAKHSTLGRPRPTTCTLKTAHFGEALGVDENPSQSSSPLRTGSLVASCSTNGQRHPCLTNINLLYWNCPRDHILSAWRIMRRPLCTCHTQPRPLLRYTYDTSALSTTLRLIHIAARSGTKTWHSCCYCCHSTSKP